MYYTCILYAKSSDKFYVGYPEDPHRRLAEHNTKPFNTYTSKHRPWCLKTIFQCTDKSIAMKTEKFIKQQKSRKLNYPCTIREITWHLSYPRAFTQGQL